MEFLEKNPTVQVAISKVAYMDEKSEIYKIKNIPFVQYDTVISGRFLFWIIFLWPTYPLKFGAVLVRKDLFEKTGAVFDISLILEATQHTSFALIDHVGLRYRNTATSISSKKSFNCHWYWIRNANKFLANRRYYALRHLVISYKFFLGLMKVIYTKFSAKRI